MSLELQRFLTKLATDPDALSACMDDPAAAMKKAGVSESEQSVMLSRDKAKIHAAIVGTAAAEWSAEARSQANAKMVAEIIASDPAVAQWLQNHFLQSMQTWGSQRPLANAPVPSAPQKPESETKEDAVETGTERKEEENG